MVGIARRPPLLPTGWVGLGSALGAWTGQGVPDRSFSRVLGLAISQPQPRTDIELKRQSCQRESRVDFPFPFKAPLAATATSVSLEQMDARIPVR